MEKQITKMRKEITINGTPYFADITWEHYADAIEYVIHVNTTTSPNLLVAKSRVWVHLPTIYSVLGDIDIKIADAVMSLKYASDYFNLPHIPYPNAVITELFVEPQHRNKGIASFLIDSIIEKSKIVAINYSAASFDLDLMYTRSRILNEKLVYQTKCNAANLEARDWLMIPMNAMHHWYSMYAVAINNRFD